MKQAIPSHPDAPLLKACVSVAVALRGASGAYEADTTDDKDFAAAIDGEMIERAAKALAEAGDYRTATLDGLRAKAEVIDMTFEAMPSDIAHKFLRSLCADIARFHRASPDTSAEVAR